MRFVYFLLFVYSGYQHSSSINVATLFGESSFFFFCLISLLCLSFLSFSSFILSVYLFSFFRYFFLVFFFTHSIVFTFPLFAACVLVCVCIYVCVWGGGVCLCVCVGGGLLTVPLVPYPNLPNGCLHGQKCLSHDIVTSNTSRLCYPISD